MDASEIQIGIYGLQSFYQNLPRGIFHVEGNKVMHDRKKANVFAKKSGYSFVDAYHYSIKVKTMDELERIESSIMTLPTFILVTLKQTEYYGNLRRYVTGKYMMYVNPKHSVIKEKLIEGFTRARQHMEEQERFSLEFDFSEILKEWFREQLNHEGHCYSAFNSSFCITSFRRRSPYCSNVPLILLCLPTCLVVAPLYCAYRKALCHDFKIPIDAIITYIQPGIISPEALRNMLTQAYLHGAASTSNTQNLGRQEQDFPPAYDDVSKSESNINFA